MKKLGISAIVADSVARLYFRSCIAYGVPIFAAPGVSGIIEEGEELKIEIGDSLVVIENTGSGAKVTAHPIPEAMAGVLKAGGVFPMLKTLLERQKQ